MRDAALALLQDTFENPSHDPRDRLLLAAGPGAAIELPESVQRSWDFGHGFAEGNGFSILQSLEALNAVVRDPGQFLSGLQALITSAEARGQLGQDILNGIRNDMQMFRDAYAAGDMRRAGQQFGKLTGDLVQLVGGVEALARLAPGLARGAGRGASAVVDRLTDPRIDTPRSRGRQAQPEIAAPTGVNAIHQTTITFGRNGNQSHHAFRHTDLVGLDRLSVQDAILADISRVGPNFPKNPYVGSTIVNNIRIEYVLYRLPDGSFNVGRITPPRIKP